ncbi:YitT family protein [Paenibacillus alba]|uniref:YitT family protein n=1 Tax=Paenibacillus alba TaxID=1197127 RepID=A0ABU6GDG7_9BACL|nr:YitT family protein [Paenibacillus alba]MEC0230724.1 YitT family protein [Paenibacillus alba]
MEHTIKWPNIAAIIGGSAIIAFGMNYFNLANGLAEGGITGLALLLKYVLGWNPAWMNLLLNIPLVLIGWKLLGRISFIYTVVGMLAVSMFLWLFERFSMPLPDPLLASLYAGAIVGLGFGIVFRFEGMTEGTDIIARLLLKHYGIGIAKTIFAIDCIVLLLSLIYLDLTRAMYTLVAIVVGAKVIDFVLEGASGARAAFIVTAKPIQIGNEIMMELQRGITFLEGRGGYTGKHSEVIYCIVSRKEIIKLKKLVHRVDPAAFVSFSDVREVVGNGFAKHDQ